MTEVGPTDKPTTDEAMYPTLDFVVTTNGSEVYLSQREIMGSAERPHMRDRAYGSYRIAARVFGHNELNDAYSIAQRYAEWLNLGIAEWQRRGKPNPDLSAPVGGGQRDNTE